MTKPFKDKRGVLWLVGGAALLIGILAWGILGPSTEEVPGTGELEMRVPGMTNVPASSAPKLDVETENQK